MLGGAAHGRLGVLAKGVARVEVVVEAAEEHLLLELLVEGLEDVALPARELLEVLLVQTLLPHGGGVLHGFGQGHLFWAGLVQGELQLGLLLFGRFGGGRLGVGQDDAVVLADGGDGLVVLGGVAVVGGGLVAVRSLGLGRAGHEQRGGLDLEFRDLVELVRALQRVAHVRGLVLLPGRLYYVVLVNLGGAQARLSVWLLAHTAMHT